MPQAMPQVKVYPLCSECRAPYVLRLAFVFDPKMRGGGERWIWQRDCKHKKAVPLASNARGLRPTPEGTNG